MSLLGHCWAAVDYAQPNWLVLIHLTFRVGKGIS